jgi:hypothetical protein
VVFHKLLRQHRCKTVAMSMYTGLVEFSKIREEGLGDDLAAVIGQENPADTTIWP